jgi:ketosteroid isomerase-like protein
VTRSCSLFSQILLLVGVAGCAATGAGDSSPRSVVEAKFAAVNRHAVADVVAYYAPGARLTASDFCGPRQGRVDVQRTYQSLFAAFPDVVAEVHEYFVQGDRVAVRLTVRGSIQGRPFAVPIANYFTVRNGLIETDDGVFDTRGRPCSP